MGVLISATLEDALSCHKARQDPSKGDFRRCAGPGDRNGRAAWREPARHLNWESSVPVDRHPYRAEMLPITRP